jgi:magnesium transporter
MAGSAVKAINELNRRYFLEHPLETALLIEDAESETIIDDVKRQSAVVLEPVFSIMSPRKAAEILKQLPEGLAGDLLGELAPNIAVRILAFLDADEVEARLDLLNAAVAKELRRLMEYPPETAGRLMDPRVLTFRETMTASEALHMLRENRLTTTRSMFIVDSENRLTGKIAIQDAAVADPNAQLAQIASPITAAVNPMAPQSEVAEIFDRYRIADLPVVGPNSVLLGIVYNATLVEVVQRDASADIQTMVGASRDERALSSPFFAVRKRLPWLQINLLTAFLAAAVVGLFEDTIARFTALAVLLPVVAGQSGNAGAQALAVTMRGLALREITIREAFRVSSKEVLVGLANGIAVAATCGIGVYLWSGSIGLVLVIASSMVLAMVAAGLAGAVVPIGLTRVGQDPAVASSIILTTVTDIAGFFSFLGIATMLAFML